MDTYFDRLDSRTLKKAGDGASMDEDDEDVAAGDFEAAANLEDLIIYESKDPYVLRSLPYLIGSQGYLENDHVGLKDLESEDEEEEEEEMEAEAKESSISSSSSSSSSEDDEQEPTTTTTKKEATKKKASESESEKSSTKSVSRIVSKKKTKKEEDLFDESESDDDDGIFNLGGKIVIIKLYIWSFFFFLYAFKADFFFNSS